MCYTHNHYSFASAIATGGAAGAAAAAMENGVKLWSQRFNEF